MEDLNDKITGNSLAAAEWNQPASEIQNIIEALGIALSNGDLDQLGKALASLVATADYYDETGSSATTYVATKIGAKQGLHALSAVTDGARIRFRPGTNNSGAAPTIAVNGLAAKTIVREDGSALQAGDLSTERDAILRYKQSVDDFLLLNAAGSSYMPRGYIDGLIMIPDAAADPLDDLLINPGITVDSAGKVTMELAAGITKQIDAAWSAGDDAGGRSGTLDVDAWYNVFLIRENTTGAIDAGFDKNLDASALLAASSYDQYRLIGAVLTDGSSEITDFVQTGDFVAWVVPVMEVDDSSVGDSEELAAIGVPLGRKINALINFQVTNAGAETSVWIYDPDQTSATPSGSVAPLNTGDMTAVAEGASSQVQVLTDASSQVAYRAADASSDLKIVTLGYWDPRGRNA